MSGTSNTTSMNPLGSQAYSSSFDLSQMVKSYVLPPMCFFCMMTNAANVIVFTQKKKLKSSIYQYLRWHSFVDLLYFIACFIRFVIRSERFKQTHSSYWTQFYELYVYLYFAGSLALLMILIELLVAYKRLLVIVNMKLPTMRSFRAVVATCVALSLVWMIPFPLNLKLVNQRECNFTTERIRCARHAEQLYALTQENIPNLNIWKNLSAASFFFRGVIAPFILFVLNIFIAIKFRQLCSRKKYLNSSSGSSTVISNRCETPLFSRIIL